MLIKTTHMCVGIMNESIFPCQMQQYVRIFEIFEWMIYVEQISADISEMRM